MTQYTDQLTARQLIRSIAHGHYELSHDKVKCERDNYQQECRSWLAAHPSSGVREEGREVIEWLASQPLADSSNDRMIREQRDQFRLRCSTWLDANDPPSSDGTLEVAIAMLPSQRFREDLDAIVDQDPDAFWAKRGMAAAFHALADLPEDAIPPDRAKLGTMLASIAREAGGLTDAEAKRFDRHAAARDDLNERIDHLARLAAGTEYALVCGACGRAISRLAAYVEQSPLSHTHAPGTCGVCGRTGSVSPSGDWIGEGD